MLTSQKNRKIAALFTDVEEVTNIKCFIQISKFNVRQNVQHRHEVQRQMNWVNVTGNWTVNTVDFQQSRPSWIQLCRQCIGLCGFVPTLQAVAGTGKGNASPHLSQGPIVRFVQIRWEVGKTGGGVPLSVSVKKFWGRAPPQIPPENGSDLNYFQFTLCHAEL